MAKQTIVLKKFKLNLLMRKYRGASRHMLAGNDRAGLFPLHFSLKEEDIRDSGNWRLQAPMVSRLDSLSDKILSTKIEIHGSLIP